METMTVTRSPERIADLKQRAQEWANPRFDSEKPYFAVPEEDYQRFQALATEYGHVGEIGSSDYDGYDLETEREVGFEAIHAYLPPERWEAFLAALKAAGYYDCSSYEDEPEDVPRHPELGKRYWISLPLGTEQVEP